jgi:hypothetical protein
MKVKKENASRKNARENGKMLVEKMQGKMGKR